MISAFGMQGALPGQRNDKSVPRFPFLAVFMAATLIVLSVVDHKEGRFLLSMTYALPICWAFAAYKLQRMLPRLVAGYALKLLLVTYIASDAASLVIEMNTSKAGSREVFNLIATHSPLLTDYPEEIYGKVDPILGRVNSFLQIPHWDTPVLWAHTRVSDAKRAAAQDPEYNGTTIKTGKEG